MRLNHDFKIGMVLLLVALASLSCKAVTGPGPGAPPRPTQVHLPSGALAFKPEQLPDAQLGAAYHARVTVENTRTPVGAFILQEGQYPPGLTLEMPPGEENTAELSGTPTQAGTYRFVLYVWCYGTNQAGQTGQKDYTIVVK